MDFEIKKQKRKHILHVAGYVCLWLILGASVYVPVISRLGFIYPILLGYMLLQFDYVWNSNGTFLYLLQNFFVFILMVLLAYAATINISFLIIINLAVPFVLVLLSANEYSKKSYFNYVVAFGYSEVYLSEYLTIQNTMLMLLYCAGCLSVMYLVFKLLHVRRSVFGRKIPGTMKSAARAFLSNDSSDGKKAVLVLEGAIKELSLNVERMERCRGKDREKHICDKYSEEDTLIVVSCQFIMIFGLLKDILTLSGKMEDKTEKTVLQDAFNELGNTLMISSLCFYDHPDIAASRISRYIEELENKYGGNENISTLRKVRDVTKRLYTAMDIVVEGREKKLLELRNYFSIMAKSFSFDEFRLRFAIRFSSALTLAFFIAAVIPLPKSYWIAFNVQFLMMPVYEDVKWKVPRQFAATVIGVAISFLYYNFVHIPGLTDPILLVSMYACLLSPVYVISVICGTVMAVIPATAYAGGNFAFLLRLVFIGIGVTIVLFFNRFVFVTKNDRELKRHFKNLISFDRELVELISSQEPNLLRIRTLLVRSNLVFASVMDYAGKEMTDEEMNVIRDFIEVNRAWDYMIAEGNSLVYTREYLYDFGGLLDKYDNNKGELYKDCYFLKAGIEKMEAFFNQTTSFNS